MTSPVKPNAAAAKRPLHLYIHIPFCAARCTFCNQRIYPWEHQQVAAYVEALLREIAMAAPDFAGHRVDSLRLGGGSPALLSDAQLGALLSAVRARFSVAEDAEITLETSPNRIRSAQLITYQNLGINRLSIGVVTARTAENALLGMRSPIGSAETALILPQLFHMHSYEATLLTGIPGQTAANLMTSLRFVLRYHTPEVSLCPLMQPAGAAWREAQAAHPPYPSGKEREAMLRGAAAHLAEKGYREYLPGRWAQDGHESRDLLAQQSAKDYLSFGAGTASRTDGILYRTTDHLARYLACADQPEEIYRVVEAAQA